MFLMGLLFAYQNLGDYLSLRWYDCFKQFVLESNEKRGKITKKTDSNNQTAACCGSRWQKIPVDIMDKTLQHLNLSDRIRLGSVCKFWNSVALRRDIRGAPDHQLPWLVLPQARNSNCLRFSSLSEGKVVELKLPKPARGGQFLSSSKGWLVMAREKGLNSDMFLLNPISGRQHQLPYLRAIPSFQTFVTTPEWKHLGARPFFRKIVLSSANVSECVVAVVFSSLKELGLCKPGDKSWSVFQVIDEDRDSIIQDILFSCGKLYASVDGPSNMYNDGVVAARTLNFGDDQDCAVELKLVVFDSYKYLRHEINEIGLRAPCLPCLLETPNNQVLFVHAMCDVLHHVMNYYLEGRPDHIRYFRTTEIRVYKIDSESGNFIRVDNLGNQILFVAEHGSCLSLRPASDFKELQGNCIYFATLGIQSLYSWSHIRPVSREIGIFYLDDGKIVRPFPSVEAYSYSIPTLPYAFVEPYSIRTRWQISWYSPSLW